MRRLKLGVAYDGTDLCGWQRQDNGPTVQAHIEDAVERMTGVKTIVRGAGRTDAGVHALGQVAHFDTAAEIPLHGFQKGLNSLLPRAIVITSVQEAAPDFDARFSARGKLYRYTIWNGPVRAPLLDRYAWHARRPLDVALMSEGARAMVGKHDFSAFRAADCERKTTVRTLTRLDVRREGDTVTIEVEADAFLKNMVRIIVGTLAYVGWQKLTATDVAAILAGGDRTRAGQTAPALGLVLVRVDY